MVNAEICFLGGGNMASSILSALIADGISAKSIVVVDRNQNKLDFLNQRFHVQTTQDAAYAVKKADIILLCVKPQSLKELILSIKPAINRHSRPLFISIVAGIVLAQIESWLLTEYAIVRGMPNTPALIGCGATALYANVHVSRQQKEMAEQILRRTGVITWVNEEALIDVATAISGSGPAYFFLMMEHMVKAAVDLGLSEKQATLLVTQTAFGASKMALESAVSLSTLRHNVTSKEGVTAAALKAFDESGFEKSIKFAIQKNLERSHELSQQFGAALTHEK
ncbi:pyrroline-5-carboxylate reductase [Fastidiosibacter lacustris]|uniref:pyrroline-5-carboxylate reductase n=1 Tax=Fastidiosibacter lacustris TaxID=2056695 RepID=UPI000E347A0E|nr:pyrroline-5-carboxylate reductase [Fastidiosibacter lacustris]